jgi:hypothetical protein
VASDTVVVVEHSCPHCGAHAAGLARSLARIERKLEKIMSEQSQLDADVQALGGVLTTIQTAETANTAAVAAVQEEIAELQGQIAAGQPVDLTGLEALINGSADGTTPGLVQAAQSVTDGVAAVQGLVPAPPA